MEFANLGVQVPLVLIPSALERERLFPLLRAEFGRLDPPAIRLCGIGPAAAGVVTADLLGQLSPSRVILVGIAGTFDPLRLPVGQAFHFDRVRMHGIGAGRGGRFVVLGRDGS